MMNLIRYVSKLPAPSPLPSTSTRRQRMDRAQYLSSGATVLFSVVSVADPGAIVPLLASVVVLAITSTLSLNTPDDPST